QGPKTGLNANDPDLRTALAVQPPVLLCPSNSQFTGPTNNKWPFSDGTTGAGAPPGGPLVALTCYKGNSGDGAFEYLSGSTPTQPPNFWTYTGPQAPNLINCYIGTDCFGLFWRYTYFKGGVKLKEISDG